MTDETKPDEGNTTTIKITKGQRFDQRVPVQVNGALSYIDVDKPTAVGDHVIESLKNAEIEFTVVAPTGETGASAGGVSADAPTLSVEGTANRVDVKNPDKGSTAAANADATPNASPTDEPPVLNDEDGDTDDDTDDKTADDSLTDKNLADLKTGLADISDAAEIDKLLETEKAGKNRVGAIAALEARKAEIEAA